MRLRSRQSDPDLDGAQVHGVLNYFVVIMTAELFHVDRLVEYPGALVLAQLLQKRGAALQDLG